MNQVKILVAGPGTGKTTKVKDIIRSSSDAKKILVLSFTNATIDDLLKSFEADGIGLCSDDCMTLHKYALRVNHLSDFHILNPEEISRLEFYADKLSIDKGQLLNVLKCITFDGMVESCANFINNNPAYANEKIGAIDLLVVDEYQDFNEKERNFISAVSRYAKTVVVLGDDDQCIYGFKNADSDGIIGLYNLAATEKIAHENKCYRCPDDVVKHCNNLIGNNQNRISKTLQISGRSGGIVFEQKSDLDTTSQYVLEEIRKIQASGDKTTIMVLSPVYFAVGTLLEKLDSEKMSYVNWFSEKITLDLLKAFWMLRAVFGAKKVFNIMMLAYDQKNDKKRFAKFLIALKEVIQSGIQSPESVEKIIGCALLDKQVCDFISNEPTVELFSSVLPNGLYSKLIPLIEDVSSRERNLERLEPLISPPTRFDQNKINVMSIHKSKGLQADYVFILGLVDGILPSEVAGIDSIEAQRRVLFVGMSRAKNKLYLISTVLWDGKYVHKVDKSKFRYDYRRKKWCGQTSLFVNELKLKR